MQKKSYLRAKRTFDICASAIGITASLPIIAIASAIIIVNDPGGNPIYAQERVGKDGRHFTMYKLRTMYCNADKNREEIMFMNESDGPVFKIKDDPRITKPGKILRKTNLDELPQLVNTFRGDMSLVGPRPPLPEEVAAYNQWHKNRLAIKPGMTCYWQIAPDRNDMPFDEWVKLDLKYIKEMNLKTDVKILWHTIGAVLKMNGR